MVRKSLPLSELDQRRLATLRRSAGHRKALEELLDARVSHSVSEAALLHALMTAGLKAVEERVEADAYAQLAEQMDPSTRKALARRRRPTWADE